MTSQISGYWPGCLAPSFTAAAVFSGSTSTLQLQSFKGKMVLLIFYPVDFGYICPTELMLVEEMLHEFQQEECEVLAISTGSIMSKVAFMSLDKDKGGVAGIKFGLVEDKEGQIGSMYGVMREDSGYSYRAMVIIDRKGVVVSRTLSDLPIGLGITDALRLVKNSKNELPDPDLNQKEESNEEVNNTIKEIPEKTDEITNSSPEIKEKIPTGTADAKGDETKTAEENAMDNTDSDVKEAKADYKLTGPEMCLCSLGYPHSAYHHQMSNLKKEEE